MSDLRYAVRALARSPAFTAVAVATLALWENDRLRGTFDVLRLEPTLGARWAPRMPRRTPRRWRRSARTCGARATAAIPRSSAARCASTDPATYAGVAGVLFAVTLIASYLPARRATRIEPTEALRHE